MFIAIEIIKNNKNNFSKNLNMVILCRSKYNI